MSLSKKQTKALGLIEAAKGYVSPEELAEALETSPEGAAATASSLVRRHLAQRARINGHVFYTAASR